jgi:hypothetical protein
MALPNAIDDAFHRQVEACLDLGSPFTAQVCRLIAGRIGPGSRFADRIASWESNPVDAALPLRAAGGLHALARSGRCPPLSKVYPPALPGDDDTLWAAISLAIGAEDDYLAAWLDRPPQTNEVARSSAILGGCLAIAETTDLPLEILEIGSSAGLNLGFDSYAYRLGVGIWGRPDSAVTIRSTWEGQSPPLDRPIAVVARAGSDAAPLDATSATDRERLLAYIWPDQAERLARTESALNLAALRGPRIERADAADWIEARLGAAQPTGQVRVVLHTIVWPYLTADRRQRIKTAIHAAGEGATERSPVAWLSVEPDGTPGSANIRLTLWPGAATVSLGRADFHGRWVRWQRDR